DRCQTLPRSQQRSVSQGIRMLRRPWQTDENTRSATGMSPGCFGACSTLVSVDLIQLCCREAVSRTWIKLLPSLDWYQHRGVLVLHQKHEELSRFRGACVAANYMNIIGTFIKALAWRERDFFAAFHLHHNGAFQHVNECMRIVPMNRIRRAGRIHDSDHQTFLAGKICEIFRQDWCDLSVLRNQGAGDEECGHEQES